MKSVFLLYVFNALSDHHRFFFSKSDIRMICCRHSFIQFREIGLGQTRPTDQLTPVSPIYRPINM